MGTVMIVAEQRDGELKKVTLEMAAKAAQLNPDADVCVALMGEGVSDMVSSMAGVGVTKAMVADDPSLKNYEPELCVEIVAGLAQSLQPELIMLAATSTGKDLAPRLAAKLDAGLASDCVDLAREGDQLVAVRPIYAGKAIAQVAFKSDLKLVTVRPNVLPAPEP